MKDKLFYKIVRPLIKAFVLIVYRPKKIGKENIPTSGSVILAGNHTNNLDCILLISSTNRSIHFLAKDSLIKGSKKIIFNNMGIIPVNRSIHDKEALNMAIETLKNDLVVGVFPEGTINRTKDVIIPFKYGAVKMASKTDSLIVPFCITGKYRPFRKGLQLVFGTPYKISDDLEKENKKLMQIVSNFIVTYRKD